MGVQKIHQSGCDQCDGLRVLVVGWLYGYLLDRGGLLGHRLFAYGQCQRLWVVIGGGIKRHAECIANANRFLTDGLG